MSLVNYEKKGKIIFLSLNRVDKLNAFSKEMISELTDALKGAGSENCSLLVLNSNCEKAFCAGADLKERLNMNEKETLEILDLQQVMVESLAALEMPTLALMNGVAFGGGFEIALACDFRICHPNALMGLSELRLGIIPGAGGTQRLLGLVGLTKAKELIFKAKKIKALEALELGIVSEVSDDLIGAALLWAEELEKAAPLALRAAKKALNSGHWAKNLHEALQIERDCYNLTLKSKDRLEGLKAFSEKRPAVFKGE